MQENTQDNTPNSTPLSLKERTARGLFWSAFGNGAQQIVTMLTGIALARILDIEDYGMVAMLSIFSIIAGNLQESGLTSALGIRREVKPQDFNAVFWFSVGVSAFLYVLLFFAAPYIADFNRTPELTVLARVVFLGFFISSLGTAQAAWLFRHLMVREKTTAQMLASLVSGVVGLTVAIAGGGCWALVAMDLVYKFTYTTTLWHFSPWRPSWRIDLRPVAGMFGFSSRILLTNMLTTLNNQLLQSLLGHFFPKIQVGYYSQANKWSLLSNGLLTGMTNSVAQPVLAKVGDDADRQVRVFRKMLRFTAFIAFPLMSGLALVAPEFIPLAIGDKWSPCVPYLAVLSVSCAFITINAVFNHLMISRGQSNLYLYSTGIFLFMQTIIILLLAGTGNMLPLLAVIALLQPLWTLALSVLARRMVNVRLHEILADTAPFALASALTMAVCWGVCTLVFGEMCSHHWWRIIPLFTKIIIAAAIYIGLMHLYHPDVYIEGRDFLKARMKKGKNT